MPDYQVPANTLNTVGQELVETGQYAPVNGVTKCNYFLDAFARQLFGYTGFQGRLANDIVTFLATGADDWKTLHPRVPQTLQHAFRLAQDDANLGFLVVVGLKVTSGHGHVAAVISGQLTPSGSWGNAGLPRDLPIIAQAGREVFAGRHLGYGITPADYNAGSFYLFVRKP